ncbi:putative reverse transcriptase domain-containing protein, partial [Tanacetum coccineum]
MPTTLTTRRAPDQVRNLLVLSAEAPAKVYVVGNAGANPDNVVAGILFDTGADRSFVSTAISSQIDITPSTL